MSSRTARAICIAVAAALTLAVAQVALAEAPKTRLNAADQAAARAAVLKPADLGTGWSGGLQKAQVRAPAPCAGWNPRQADLVVTGAAQAQYVAEGVVVQSSAHVYANGRMIALDWQRTVVGAPLRCLSKEFADSAGEEIRVVSIKRLPFPKLATYNARIRIVADYIGSTTVRVFIDAVLVGRGRTAVALGLVAPYTERASADAAEVRLAKIVLARIKA
jgi:hypothetical protein